MGEIAKKNYFVRMAEGVEDEMEHGEDLEDPCPSLTAVPKAYEEPQRKDAKKAIEEDAATVVKFLAENLPEETVRRVCELIKNEEFEHAKKHGGKLARK